ncbi:MAG: cytochrome c family protein [Arenicella sp.]|nr:cytochrome c family protein [Arenicella sp.]
MNISGQHHRFFELKVARCVARELSKALFLLCSIVALAPAQAQQVAHIGVAGCAGSTCHGSNVAFAGSNVVQNEFRIWNEQDPHARAYKTLLTAESQAIARKLGIGDAHTDDLCLGCHADNVSAEFRGDDFQIADGVGCEVCHGGAGDYLDIHADGDHQANLDAGLYPTEQPEARARMCVSCHVGNQTDRRITHQIMGAGHPRLSFELNTFSTIQPAHYRVDEDYIERKGNISELQMWAVGQLVAAEQMLDNVEAFPRSGLFPEFVHMDCLGCHQAMSKITWSKNPLTQQKPGALRYNDSHLMMSYQIALAVAPSAASQLLKNIRVFLNSAESIQSPAATIGGLRRSMATLKSALQQQPITSTQGFELLKALLDIGLASSHRDYASAEQSAMAINSVLKVMDADGMLSANRSRLTGGLDSIYAGLNDAEHYRPKEFLAGLRKIKSAIN